MVRHFPIIKILEMDLINTKNQNQLVFLINWKDKRKKNTSKTFADVEKIAQSFGKEIEDVEGYDSAVSEFLKKCQDDKKLANSYRSLKLGSKKNLSSFKKKKPEKISEIRKGKKYQATIPKIKKHKRMTRRDIQLMGKKVDVSKF